MTSIEKLLSYYEYSGPKLHMNSTAKNVHLLESTVFSTGRKKLVYIGASHRYGGSAQFQKFLIEIIERLNPKAVLIEVDHKISRESLMKWPQQIPKEQIWEPVVAIELSKKYGYLVFGMDESEVEVGHYFIKNVTDGFELFLFLWLHLRYRSASNKDMEGFSTKDVYEIISRKIVSEILLKREPLHFLNRYLPRLERKYKVNNVSDLIDGIMKSICAKYITNGNMLDIISNVKYFDDPGSYKYKISRYFVMYNAVRERRMLDTCLWALDKYDKVLAISGSWHIAQLRPAIAKELEKKYGNVQTTLWKDLKTDSI